jgi:predicted acylesterase/phospholipase RssA
MLVDGWVCDPLPAGVVRAAGFERVIAIDLSPRGPPDEPPREPKAAVAPPGLGGRLRILAIAMRAMELASQEHVARSLPLIDVLVRPDLDGFSSADLDGAAEMCARGEAAAEARSPRSAKAPPPLRTRMTAFRGLTLHVRVCYPPQGFSQRSAPPVAAAGRGRA